MGIVLTKKLIENFLTKGHGINNKQTQLLGITLSRRWKTKLVGREISQELYDDLFKLKGSTSQKHNLIKKQKKAVVRDKPPTDKWTKEELNNILWKNKHDLILERDGHKCTSCDNTSFLQVHHNFYYIPKASPWSYPDDSLVTLCGKCHRKWHNENKNKYVKNPIISETHDKDMIRKFMTYLINNQYVNKKFISDLPQMANNFFNEL